MNCAFFAIYIPESGPVHCCLPTCFRHKWAIIRSNRCFLYWCMIIQHNHNYSVKNLKFLITRAILLYCFLKILFNFRWVKFAVVPISNYPRASLNETSFNYTHNHGVVIKQSGLILVPLKHFTLLVSIKSM